LPEKLKSSISTDELTVACGNTCSAFSAQSEKRKSPENKTNKEGSEPVDQKYLFNSSLLWKP